MMMRVIVTTITITTRTTTIITTTTTQRTTTMQRTITTSVTTYSDQKFKLNVTKREWAEGEEEEGVTFAVGVSWPYRRPRLLENIIKLYICCFCGVIGNVVIS